MLDPSSELFEPFASLTPEVLRRAISIFLEYAYPGGELPPLIAGRLAFRDDRPIREILDAPPFERLRKTGDRSSDSYLLRLGNVHYPHMKLELTAYPCSSGYVLTVNTHDRLQLKPDWPGHDQFRALQEQNLHLKQAIEAAWEAAGLPTFHQTLRGQIERRKAERAGEG